MPESERVYFIKRRRTTNAEILTVPVRAHTHHAHDHAEVGKQARGRNCGRVGEVKSGEPRELCVCVHFASVCTFCQRKAARRPGCIHICMQMHIHKVSKAKLQRHIYKPSRDSRSMYCRGKTIKGFKIHVIQYCNSRPYRINHTLINFDPNHYDI